jgi:polygalacturonase
MGRGTIDGNGPVLRNHHGRPVQILDAHDCTNLLLEGVVLRNTASWTCHLVHSTNVRVRNLRIIADWDVGNADGINPDMCQNVLIENAFCYTGDDSFAVKATHVSDYIRPCMNITIRDSVVMTYKTALKVGTETYADVRNVLFENIDVVHSSRGCALWVRDGGHVSNVVYRDIRMDLVEIAPEGRSGQPFYLYLSKRHGEGSTLSEVLFQNITCRAPWFSFLDSNDPTPIGRITFDHVEWTVLPRERKQDKKYLFEFDNARNIDFRNVMIDWTEANMDQWHGLWAEDAPVSPTDVVERGTHP